MANTVLAVIAEAVKFLGSENEGDIAVGEEWLRQVVADIEATAEWDFARTTKALTTIAGQQSYPMGNTGTGALSIANYSKGLIVHCAAPATYKKLKFLQGKRGKEQFYEMDDGQLGWPMVCIILDSNLILYPTPTVGKAPTGELIYMKNIPEWADREADFFTSTGIPARYRETIIAGIITKGAFAKDDTNLDKYKVIYEQGLAKMAKETEEA